MAVFLTVHARYKDVQLGVFRDGKLLASADDESKKISKRFIELLDAMLKKESLLFSDLSFAAVHQGPAPFTTLRVCLATVNGLAFATGLPLVGINGLEALIDSHKAADGITVALLNAFGNDIYYGLWNPETQQLQYGYAPAHSFLEELKKNTSAPLLFLGNGSGMYRAHIDELFKHQAQFKDVELASLESIAQKALVKWHHQDVKTQLMPLYLKDYSATPPSR